MLENFSDLLQFSYTSYEKKFIFMLLMIDGIGRKTVAEALFYLKKHEVEHSNLWVFFMGIIKKNLKIKKLIDKVYISNLEQKYYSIIEQYNIQEIKVIAFWEVDYPKLLKQTNDFPLLLFIAGETDVLQKELVAVVGTRRITSYGESVTEKLVGELIDYDYGIVSGCMYGVDAKAHQVAIKNSGKTVAVLGYGFDVVPASMKELQDQILKNGGCIVTEYLPWITGNKGTFPQRNRIVAGMSLAVLVIEAGLKSGTHITVDFALESGREVFAVPGSIFNPYTQGTKFLLNQGATLVSSGNEIVAQLRKKVTIPISFDSYGEVLDLDVVAEKLGLDEISRRIVQATFFNPQTTSDLEEKTSLPIDVLLKHLGMLELENIITNEAGMWQCVLS